MTKFTEIEKIDLKKAAEEFTRNAVLATTVRAAYNWTKGIANICTDFNDFCEWIEGDSDWRFDAYKDLKDLAIKNNLAVFDLSVSSFPIQSVLFEGIDYTCIEDSSVWNCEEYPAEYLRIANPNTQLYSSDFGGITKYCTERFNRKLVTYLNGYDYLLNDNLDCGYKLPGEEILDILKKDHFILMITYDTNHGFYDAIKYSKCDISKYYDLVKVTWRYVILVRKGANIDLAF